MTGLSKVWLSISTAVWPLAFLFFSFMDWATSPVSKDIITAPVLVVRLSPCSLRIHLKQWNVPFPAVFDEFKSFRVLFLCARYLLFICLVCLEEHPVHKLKHVELHIEKMSILSNIHGTLEKIGKNKQRCSCQTCLTTENGTRPRVYWLKWKSSFWLLSLDK